MSLRKAPTEPLLVIMGSTGTGKSDLAVELACRFNGEIINADAMQMYRGLPIITNKISVDEQRGIPHHLLGCIGLEEPTWDVHVFKTAASRIIQEIRSRGRLPILVGGSQYYTDGLLFKNHLVEDFDDDVAKTDISKDTANAYPVLDGPTEAMFAKLKEVDPAMANRWHPNDKRKIRRSLEIFLTTGRRASEIYVDQQKKKDGALRSVTMSPWQPLFLWVYSNKDVLEKRVFARIDKMLENGLMEETQELHDYLQVRTSNGEKIDRTKGIYQSIGFKAVEPYLQGLKQNLDPSELGRLKEAGLDEMRFGTRQYAKHQVGWIKKKTVPLIKEAELVDQLFVLDSSDISQWNESVCQIGTRLSQIYLDGGELPSPTETSNTAQEVLSSALDRSRADQSIPCHKTCEICQTTLLTEKAWEGHLNGTRHRRAAKAKRKMALVATNTEQLDEEQQQAPAAGLSKHASPTSDTI